ncbi:hypothetical protein LJ707_05500 [Mucilaginibacter sp. UR6-1]|uniref:hypothetical protein n=1 Tax=Mucilaginibacter sp. UR6-1 TaxID=1435643 RepID=UPI001E306454|nr:hypothetical protein [Mucilaginibacter sp. UR6-1]MCC8408375.1 hypothetical protein [Mucilaginibacter sp. UR6-1]
MAKKKGFFSKNWLKYTNREAYKLYKYNLDASKRAEYAKTMFEHQHLFRMNDIVTKAQSNGSINFSHSGNSGDIIYSLPTIKKLHELTGLPVNLYLKINQPMQLAKGYTHPLGNVMLNQKMAELLIPLVAAQPYINTCDITTTQRIDIDLDYFRAGLIPLDKGNIARWCGYITGVNLELWKKWLFVEPDASYNDTIIVARSERYRNLLTDHSFLQQYKNKLFIGVKSEYDDIKQIVPDIEWLQVSDFLKLASVIAGCKFFIGNQSFPFSIAEGLKVKRVLETSFDVINVVPEGEGGHDFLFQSHFESIVAELNA